MTDEQRKLDKLNVKKHKDTLVAYSTIILCFICYVLALYFNDIPGYEADYLRSVPYLLHWGIIYYLPVFPLVAIVFGVAISESKSKSSAIFSISATNFMLTLLFAIFAYSANILSISWTFLGIGSFIFLLTAIYDKSNNQNNSNK